MLEIIHVVVHIIMKQNVYLLTGMDRWMDSYYYLNARRSAFIHQAMVSEFGLESQLDLAWLVWYVGGYLIQTRITRAYTSWAQILRKIGSSTWYQSSD